MCGTSRLRRRVRQNEGAFVLWCACSPFCVALSRSESLTNTLKGLCNSGCNFSGTWVHCFHVMSAGRGYPVIEFVNNAADDPRRQPAGASICGWSRLGTTVDWAEGQVRFGTHHVLNRQQFLTLEVAKIAWIQTAPAC